MPCFQCHVVIKLPACHSAFMLGTKKTWPNRLKRRLGIPVEGRADANRRTAVRAGNARPEAWGKKNPSTLNEWQEWAFNEDQRDWAQKEAAFCWSKDPQLKRAIASALYYANHEENKRKSAENARKRYYKYKHTPEFKLRKIMRNVISRIARKTKSKKSRKTNEYLGCTFQEARTWIERQFTQGMSWDNHGEWEMHHKIPLAEWDLTDPQQMVRATHFTNLQPLWRHENRSIGARLVGHHQMALL